MANAWVEAQSRLDAEVTEGRSDAVIFSASGDGWVLLSHRLARRVSAAALRGMPRSSPPLGGCTTTRRVSCSAGLHSNSPHAGSLRHPSCLVEAQMRQWQGDVEDCVDGIGPPLLNGG